MRAGCRNIFEKIGDICEPGVAGALVVERAVTHERELGAVIGKFIDLPVVELERAYRWCRLEKPATATPETAVGGECRVGREPARDCRRHNVTAMAGGNLRGRFFERMAAVVERESFEDFVDRIGLVAQGARTRGKGSAARAAAVQGNVLKLLFARALFSEARAVAVGAALGLLYRGRCDVRARAIG